MTLSCQKSPLKFSIGGNEKKHNHTLPLHCPHYHEEKAKQNKSKGHKFLHTHDEKRIDMVEVFSDPRREDADKKNSLRVKTMIFLTGSFMLVELIVGLVWRILFFSFCVCSVYNVVQAAGSLALVADSFHMLSDLGALLIGLMTIHATRKARSSKKLVDLSWVSYFSLFFLFLLNLLFSFVLLFISLSLNHFDLSGSY